MKRTSKAESPGPGVLTKSAAALEPIGVEDSIKKLFLPWRKLELGAVNADGDVKVYLAAHKSEYNKLFLRFKTPFKAVNGHWRT